MKKNYDVFWGQEDLINKVIEFYLADAINPEKFAEIKTICLDWDNKMLQGRGATMINMGYFTVFDFIGYVTQTKQIGSGIKSKLVDILLELMEDELIVVLSDDMLNQSTEKRYRANNARAKFAYDRGLIKNLIFGFNYIIKKYSTSVFKIENIKGTGEDEKIGIGTGFLLRYRNQKGEAISAIITNKHVVENCTSLRVIDEQDNSVSYSKIQTDPNRDLAVIELSTDIDLDSFHLYPQIKELSEIITIGYPKIPLAKQAYQVYHKGEVNSHIENYFGSKLFLFSAKTSPGNSGGPIIDRNGMVVGIVSEMLFEQEEFFKKGILGYSAGIPGMEIIDFLNNQYLTGGSL